MTTQTTFMATCTGCHKQIEITRRDFPYIHARHVEKSGECHGKPMIVDLPKPIPAGGKI